MNRLLKRVERLEQIEPSLDFQIVEIYGGTPRQGDFYAYAGVHRWGWKLGEEWGQFRRRAISAAQLAGETLIIVRPPKGVAGRPPDAG